MAKVQPSPYSRRPLKKSIVYNIYGILYDDALGERSIAVASAESDDEALGMLEKSLVEDKGYERMKGDLNAEIILTEFSSPKKGLIFGFDRLSNSYL
jgi:hypothetical protein